MRSFCCLLAVVTATVLPLAAADDEPVDHARLIRSLDAKDLEAGRKIYQTYCVACHGPDGTPPPGMVSRAFRSDALKFGNDPYAMWQTLTSGNGQMPMQSMILDPEQRYQVIHYLREHFLKEHNPGQYVEVDAAYLRSLPDPGGKPRSATLPQNDDGFKDPKNAKAMDYGPGLNHNLVLPGGTIERACFLRREPLTIVYDGDTDNLAAAWRGDFLDTGDTHLNRGKGTGHPEVPRKATIAFHTDAPLASEHRFLGRYHHGGRLIRAVEVGDRRVLDSADVHGTGDAACVLRHLEVGPGSSAITLTLFGGSRFQRQGDWLVPADTGKKATGTALRLIGELDWQQDQGRVTIPASRQPLRFSVLMTVGDGADQRPNDLASIETPDLGQLVTRGGPRQWDVDIAAPGSLGPDWMGYASDELPLPQRNPWGAWIRPLDLAFYPDGRLALSTWNGDIWMVHGIDRGLENLRWQRVAAGLYEPMGLLVVDGVLMARCRDRIWRFHDLNGDHEFDYYENFFTAGRSSTGYHAFLFGLVRDSTGRFYYVASGRKSPDYDHFNGVIQVAADGSSWKRFATGVRHANGIGISPDDHILLSDNEGEDITSAGIMWLKGGEWLGFGEQPAGTHRARPVPWIPHDYDSSSGGQAWSDAERFGPLSDTMIHSSYGTGSLFAIWSQEVGDQRNGFGWRLPHIFRSGVMRVAVDPVSGQAFTCGLIGWDFRGRKKERNPLYDGVDYQVGALHRLRHTGVDDLVPIAMQAERGALRIRFGAPVDSANRSRLQEGSLRIAGSITKKGARKGLSIAEVRGKGDEVILVVPDLETCELFQFEARIAPAQGPEQRLELFGSIYVLP